MTDEKPVEIPRNKSHLPDTHQFDNAKQRFATAEEPDTPTEPLSPLDAVFSGE